MMEDRTRIFQDQVRSLEDMFFLKQDQILREQRRLMEHMKQTRENLSKVSGITDQNVLDRLIELDIKPDLLATLALIPLIEVAWADGFVDEKEKAAILKADSSLFAIDSIDMTILTQWLEHKPEKKLMTGWQVLIKGLCQEMTTEQKTAFRHEVVGHARTVAEAAGGFLGFGNKISASEQLVLDELDSAFE